MQHSLKNCVVHMCEQCNAATSMFALSLENQEVLPGYYLVRATRDANILKKDDWGLVCCNDPDFVWSVTPKPDKFWGMSDEVLDLLPDSEQTSMCDWEAKTHEFGSQILTSMVRNQHSGFFKTIQVLQAACQAKGWNSEEASMERWLFHYLGVFLTGAQEFKHEGL